MHETGDGSGRARRRRWPWVIVGLGCAAVALVVASLVIEHANRAKPVTTAQATRRLGPTGTMAPTLDRPAAGVYQYRGTGTIRLSFPPLSQPEGPTMPGTVKLLAGGCWQFRLDFSTNEWETWVYCRRGADLDEMGGQTWQRWMIGPTAITDTSTFRCIDGSPMLPAKRTAGLVWTARCTGTNTSVKGVTVTAGPYRFIGEETITVGHTAVRAAHFLRTRMLSGAQTGTERTDVWFADDTGLPIRSQHHTEVKSNTPVGVSTYHDDGQFDLTSLTPTG